MRIRRTRLRDDELWDDLKYWLENPITAEENALRQQEEEKYINAVLDKAFGESPTQIKSKEPYLNYADLLDDDSIEDGIETGMAAPLEGKVVQSYPRDPYSEIDERMDLTDEEKAIKKEQIAEIQSNAESRNREIDIENAKQQGKLWGGAALQVAGAMTPFGKIAPAAKVGSAIAKKIAPTFGRKIANEIAKGTVEGTLSGAVEGVGRGLVEDENPLETMAQDANAGLVLGSAGGAAAGNVEKFVRGKLIKNNNTLKGIDKKLHNKRVNKYYQDYEQGVNTTLANGINVKLPSDGMKETITQNPAYVDKVVNLSKDLRNAEVVSIEPPIHNHKYPIKQFHRLKGDNADYYVAENERGNYYFHKVATPDLTGPKPEDQGSLKSFDYKKPNQRYSMNILPQPPQTINSNLENISKKPSTFGDWLEELKRKRRLKGW